jgi:hypothetical protein
MAGRQPRIGDARQPVERLLVIDVGLVADLERVDAVARQLRQGGVGEVARHHRRVGGEVEIQDQAQVGRTGQCRGLREPAAGQLE